MADHGTFYWNELMTWDVEKSKAFYAETLGWTYDPFPMEDGTYWVIMVGGKPAGGMLEMKGGEFVGTPEHWFAHVAVDDVDDRVAKVEAAGGTIVRKPFDMPQVGRIAIVTDPGGASIGWITPAPQE